MAQKILITGGTGTVGMHLSNRLREAGHEIVHLSRNPSKKAHFPTFEWDIKKSFIDEKAFSGITHIVHLAGAGVADERWTDERKKVILKSRVDSAELLYQYIKKLDIHLESYVSASAIGIYGDTGNDLVDEESARGSGFLADVVEKWEASADTFSDITRVAKVRIGVVLSSTGGALEAMAKPVKLYAGAPLGSGKQYMSWIHQDDLVEIFKHVIEEKLAGVYNAVAPNPVSNATLTKSIASALNKPLILPNVPAFAMRLMLGEMAQMVLDGARVSSSKVESTGFKFKFENDKEAVNDLLH